MSLPPQGSGTTSSRFPVLALDRVAQLLGGWTGEGGRVNFAPGQSSFDVWQAIGEPPPVLPPGLIGRYGDLNGSLVLREAIGRRMSQRLGGRIGADQICITNGGSEALMLALHLLLPPGGELLMPRSCYPGYRPLHLFFGAARHLLPLRPDLNVDIDAAEAALRDRPQVLLVNSPSNPFGSVLSAADLQRLGRLPIPVIFDEVYQPLPLDGEPVPSAASLTDRHFIVGSFAKSLAVPGLRLGFLVSPPHLAEEIVNIKALVSVCSSLAAQHVLEFLLERWDLLEAAHQAHLRACLQHFRDVCGHIGLPLMAEPRAGLFATVALGASGRHAAGPLREACPSPDAEGVRAAGEDRSLEVALELAGRHGIGVVPSTDFQDAGASFLRLNFSVPRSQVEPGLVRLQRCLTGLGVLAAQDPRPN